MNDLQTTVTKVILKICSDFPDKPPGRKQSTKENIFDDEPGRKSTMSRDIDKVFIACQGVMIKDWTQTNVVVSIVQRDKEYGFVVFEGKKLATDRFIDIYPADVFPIDRTFRCELGKGVNSISDTTKSVIPLRVTCRNLGMDGINVIKFEIDSHEGAMNLNSQIKRILEKLPEAPPPDPKPKNKAKRLVEISNEFYWLKKYDSLAKEHAKKRNIQYDETNVKRADMDEVEEYMMSFTDPGSFQSVMSTPPTMAAMMLTSLIIANPLKNKVTKQTKSKKTFNRAFVPSDFSKKKQAGLKLGCAEAALAWLSDVEHSSAAAMDSTNYFIRRKLIQREREYCKCVSHTIFVGTWNVSAVRAPIPDIELKDWFETQSALGIQPDFYVLGLQDITDDEDTETASKIEEMWLKQIESAPQFKDNTYVRVFRSRMNMITIVTYVKKELYNYINTSNILSGNIVVGQYDNSLPFGNLWTKTQNKGAVALRMDLFHTSICFVCCHLSAGEDSDHRNQDFSTIMSNLTFTSKSGRLIQIRDHDLVFMFGTMNYRIILDSETVRENIDNEDYDKLQSFDELNRERLSKRAFGDFSEGDLDFPPTYKYVYGSDDFDYSEIPSYADRILWCGSRCDQLFYKCHERYEHGEHKPVTALFNVGFRKIDGRLLHKTYEAVSKHIDMLFNISMPKGEVDTNDVKLGKVTFMEPKSAYITLKNTGITPFMFDFNAEVVSEDSMPKWLTIDPICEELQQDDDVKIKFEVLLDGENIIEIWDSNADLNKTIVLCLIGGKHIFINIIGEFQPTSFGLPLGVLVNMDKPAVKYKTEELVKLIDQYKAGKLHPPKKSDTTVSQVTRLVDYIGASGGIVESDLFRTPGQHHEVLAVIEALDSTPPSAHLPEVGVHAVIETLLTFLQCLPNTVICSSHTARCFESIGNLKESRRVINSLPVIHKNLFHYIIAFLKACLENRSHNGTDPHFLATTFCDVMIDDLVDSPANNMQERKTFFLIQFLESDH